MTEEEVRGEARLYALEWAVSQIWCVSLMATGIPRTFLKEIRGQALQGARSLTFPSVDPAMSDLYASEIEVAIDRLLAMLQALLEKQRSRRTP